MAIPAAATQFIDGVLKAIKAPITSTTVTGFIDWLANEQGGPNLTSFVANQGNPLGIQTPEAQASGKAGDLATAIKLTANELLTNGDYADVVQSFRAAKSPEDIATQIVASPWNGARYGGITNFMSVAGGGQSATPATGVPSLGDQNPTGTTITSGAIPANVTSVNGADQAGDASLLNVKADYTGPGAYKGFDISAIPSALRQQTINAIDAFAANPNEEKNILNDIVNHYGVMSWVASDPEVLTVLVSSAYNSWATKDPATYQSALIATSWWQKTSDNQRLWQETEANDPGQAHAAILQAQSRVTNIANSLGVGLTPAQLSQIATTVVQQSVTAEGQFSNTAFTDQQIYQAVTGAIQSTQFQNSLTQAPTTAATATPTTAATSSIGGSGDSAALYNAFTTIARNYYLPLTPTQIAAKVQQAIQSDTGEGNFQSGAIAGFTTYAQNQAKTLYPALSSTIGTTASTGTDNTPYASMANYRALIATYTGYQGDPDTIDLTNPQWSWILSGKPPPTGNTASGITASPVNPVTTSSSATPTLPTYDQVQQYLMQTPQYQSTDMAKTQAWQVGSAITKAFGYN